jgi:hypothetical protein
MIGGSMDKATDPKTAKPKLALKKETLRHLRVRTDLKGGLAAICQTQCTRTHSCVGAQFGAAVINPVAR